MTFALQYTGDASLEFVERIVGQRETVSFGQGRRLVLVQQFDSADQVESSSGTEVEGVPSPQESKEAHKKVLVPPWKETNARGILTPL